MNELRHCIIVGSSRGLGAALVEEFLTQSKLQLIGIARTRVEEVRNSSRWLESGRYRHIELDISSMESRDVLKSVAQELPPEPVCLIFNAAHIEKDINVDKTINFDAFERVNRVNIIGFGNVLSAFEDHMMRHGGVLVGISSFWGSVPPLYLPWMAYPATKAYLNMALRCLRVAWRDKVKVVLITIGNIKDSEDSALPGWIIPTYSAAAKKVVRSILRKNIPKEIHYPLWHSIVYRYLLRFMPETVYSWVFKLYFKIESIVGNSKEL
jgi:NAD(P)-dependent dehydrogenase (short-subunit alcohol dehydrogenase family)